VDIAIAGLVDVAASLIDSDAGTEVGLAAAAEATGE
jgi:hypothetical protein